MVSLHEHDELRVMDVSVRAKYVLSKFLHTSHSTALSIVRQAESPEASRHEPEPSSKA